MPFKHTLKRWGYIILLGLISAIIVESVLHLFFESKTQGITEFTSLRDTSEQTPLALERNWTYESVRQTSEISPRLPSLLYILSGIVFFWLILKWTRFRPHHLSFSNLVFYPSWTWAIPIGIAGVSGLRILRGEPAAPSEYILYLAGGCLGLSLFISLISWMKDVLIRLGAGYVDRFSKKDTTPAQTPATEIATELFGQKRTHIIPTHLLELYNKPPQELIDWARKKEAPVNEKDDLFDRSELVTRLTELIKKKENSIALLGAWGSGKTSVIRMVLKKIEADNTQKNVIPVTTSCWGFEDAKNVQAYILSKIISELNKHVDTLTLKSLPNDFLSTIKSQNNWLALFISLFETRDSPEEELEKLIPVLQATGLHILLIVEDADREMDPHISRTLQAFLDKLKRIENLNLNFILTTKRNANIDYNKICEHIEDLPHLEPEMVKLSLDKLREWMEQHDSSIIYPSQQQHPFLLPDDFVPQTLNHWNTYSLADALAGLIRDPRQLKGVIAKTSYAWEKLKGEVFMDDLLILTALRECVPEVLTFLENNLNDLCIIQRGKPTGHAVILQKGLYDKAIEHLKSAGTEINKSLESTSFVAALALADVFFNKFHDMFNTKRCMDYSKSIQRVRSEGAPSDYWRRLTRGSLLDSEIRDQKVLHFIQNTRYHDGELDKLAERIYESEPFTEVFCYFAKCLNWDQHLLRRLQERLYKLARDKEGAEANTRNLTGAFKLWNLDLQYGFEPQWVKDQIFECLPNHLALAYDLFRLWCMSRAIEHYMNRTKQPENYRETFYIEVWQDIYSRLENQWRNRTSIDDFASCFGKNDPYTLRNIVLPMASKKEISEHKVTLLYLKDQLSWLSPLLLNALKEERHREVIIPQVAMLLFENRRQDPDGYDYSERPNDFTRSILGGHAVEILDVLYDHYQKEFKFNGLRVTDARYVELKSQLSAIESAIENLKSPAEPPSADLDV